MEFRTYQEVRIAYNAKKDSLSPEQLQEMIKSLGQFHALSVNGKERELIDDLIDDMEIFRDEPVKEKPSVPGLPVSEIIRFIAPSNHIVITVLDDAPKDLLKECEIEAIRICLNFTSGNRTKAAKALGVSIRTLRNKLNEYNNDGRIASYDLSRVC